MRLPLTFPLSLPPGAVLWLRSAAWLWGLDVLPPGADTARWPVEVIVPLLPRAAGQQALFEPPAAGTPAAGPPTAARPRADPLPGAPPRPLRPPDPFTTPAPVGVDVAGGGMRVRAGWVPEEDVTMRHGVRVTGLERTALDCGRWLPRLEAVAALDQFLRRGADPAVLAARAAALAGRPGVRQLREVLAMADPGAESPGESWTRAHILDAGLPRPATQVPVAGPAGRRYRVDLGDPGRRVGAEYDGEEHHTGPRDTARDRQRRSHLQERGWRIVTVTKQDALTDPRPFLAAYLAALRSRGWQPGEDHLCTVLARVTLTPRRSR